MRSLCVGFVLVGCTHTHSWTGPTPECVARDAEYRTHDPELAAREAEYIRGHPSSISKDEAIAIAEQFLRSEGFTTEPATVEQPHREIMEGFSTEETLANRRDTLVAQAVGARRRARYWIVAFPFSPHAHEHAAIHGRSMNDQHGRAVGVTIDGKHAFIQHQDVSCLAAFELEP